MRSSERPSAGHCPISQVPRKAVPSSAALQAVVDATSPVVITRERIAGGRLLTPADLKTAFGSYPVTVSITRDGSFRPTLGATMEGREMPFGDFATYVEQANSRVSETLYLSQFSINASPVTLGDNLAVPSHIAAVAGASTANLWFGPAGTISPLHFDRSHNLLHQHFGHKHVVLYSPSQSHRMVPGTKNSATPHVSALDLVTTELGVDFTRINAPCFECTLAPGDTLFIPAFWWHHVAATSTSISVNYWWAAPLAACLYPNFFRMASSRSILDDPAIIGRWIDLGPHRLDTAFCLHLADEGHIFLAAVLVGAIITAFCRTSLEGLGYPDPSNLYTEADQDLAPIFDRTAALIGALAAQEAISDGQWSLLTTILEVGKDAAKAPEPIAYSRERSAVIRGAIARLHAELGERISA